MKAGARVNGGAAHISEWPERLATLSLVCAATFMSAVVLVLFGIGAVVSLTDAGGSAWGAALCAFAFVSVPVGAEVARRRAVRQHVARRVRIRRVAIAAIATAAPWFAHLLVEGAVAL
jgi:hypothetical protein